MVRVILLHQQAIPAQEMAMHQVLAALARREIAADLETQVILAAPALAKTLIQRKTLVVTTPFLNLLEKLQKKQFLVLFSP